MEEEEEEEALAWLSSSSGQQTRLWRDGRHLFDAIITLEHDEGVAEEELVHSVVVVVVAVCEGTKTYVLCIAVEIVNAEKGRKNVSRFEAALWTQ